jgi:hypothetical protein
MIRGWRRFFHHVEQSSDVLAVNRMWKLCIKSQETAEELSSCRAAEEFGTYFEHER